MALKYALNRFSMLFSKPERGAPSSSRIPFACRRNVWSFRIFDACLRLHLDSALVTLPKSGWLLACSGRSNAVGSGIHPKHGSVSNVTSLLHRSSFAALALMLSQPALAQTKSSPFVERETPARAGLADTSSEKKVEALLRKMTLEEKVGQLVQFSAGQPTGPGTGRTDYEDMIAKGQIGALFNISTAKETNAYQRIAVEKSRLHIPIVFGLDVVNGFRTEFPIPLGLASTWDPPLVEQVARAAAREASASGIRWTFAPMVDIARDARWGRIAEGAGEDPFLGSEMAAAYVRGYQGSRLDASDSIAACAKHFVGYGAAEGPQ